MSEAGALAGVASESTSRREGEPPPSQQGKAFFGYKTVKMWHQERRWGQYSVRSSRGLTILCLALVVAQFLGANVYAVEAPAQGATAPSGKTFGYVLSYFNFSGLRPGAYDLHAACPDGPNYSEREQWEAQFPTLSARRKHLEQCSEIRNRGPNCENVWFSPELIQDPLPHKLVQSKIADGVDLDGGDKKSSCPHEEFTSPEGDLGIDNQFYRYFGCTGSLTGYAGSADSFYRRWIHDNIVYRDLLEISGVDDELNDSDVDVTMYSGRDPLIVDATGKAAPWQSQRIDSLLFRVHGRIVKGMLITDPADVAWRGEHILRRLLIRGMSLQLRLVPDGASGLRVGYIDAQQFWESYSHYAADYLGAALKDSGPSSYRALLHLADGYKDPKTGTCTALSSAQYFEYVRAYLVRAREEPTP